MIIQRKRVAKRLASGLLAGALALGGLAISSSSVSAKTPIAGSSAVATDGRVGGADRYETATRAADGYLALRTTSGWNAIVVASGSNFPDALSASGLAGALTAPVILLPSDGSMPDSVYEWALSRRVQIQANSVAGNPFTVYVVGGESAVPAAGVDALMGVLTKDDATPAVSKRIAGATRAETAQLVALEKSAAGANLVMSPTKPVFLVNDSSFADALSIAPYAFNQSSPILLTSATSLSAEAQAVLTQYRTLGGSNIVILGGTTAVSTAVEEALVNMGFAYASITRVSGADRYATSVAIAKYTDGATLGGANWDATKMTFASGQNFADGLAGAPLTGFSNGAGTARLLLLVQPNAVPAAVQTYIASKAATGKPTNMFVLGGTAAVSADVPTAVSAAAQSVNATSTLTCVENSAGTSVTLTVAGNLSNANGADGSIATTEAALLNYNMITVNGTAQAAGAATGTYSALTGSTTIPMTVAAGSLTPGKVIAFSGLNEIQNTAIGRVIGGSTCVVADDAVPPSVTIDARVPGAANSETGVFYVTFSEPVTIASVTFADFTSDHTFTSGNQGFVVAQVNSLDGVHATVFKVTQFDDTNNDDTKDAAGSAVDIASVDGTTNESFLTKTAHGLVVGDKVTIAGVTQAGDNGTFFVKTVQGAQEFSVSTTAGGAVKNLVDQANDVGTSTKVGESAVALAATKTITFAKDGATDRSANTGPAAAVAKTINAITDADITAATLTGSMTCTQTGNTTLINEVSGSLFMTSDAIYGPEGVDGNLYAFKVTNVRGQLIPKVVVDDTAKTITLTADLAYSSESDVKQSMSNDGIVAWTFDQTGAPAVMGAVEANLAAGTYATAGSIAGTQSCVTTLTASENIQAYAGVVTATTVVAGTSYASSGASTAGTAAANTKLVIAAVAPPLPVAAGTVTLTLLGGPIRDIAGNASLTTVGF